MIWKRSMRKIPDSIWNKLQRMQGTPVKVGFVRSISRSDLESGLFRHLGLIYENEHISLLQPKVIPPKSVGKWSNTNLIGKEKVLKSLPKVTRLYPGEVPNFGDWSKGSHTTYRMREVYQREFIAPKGLAIEIELLGQKPGSESNYLIRFTIEEILIQNSPNFEDDLFYNLNLIQENVGGCDIFPVDASRNDYLRTLFVGWEILPPGTRDHNIDVIFPRTPGNTEERKRLIERYDFLNSFGPTNIISGHSGFHRYFGAKYGDNLVVFEHLEYGNATYVMGANWEELSRLSRTELMAKCHQGYRRIRHTTTWQNRLGHIIREYQQGKLTL